MAEKIFKDTGLLLEFGKTQSEFEEGIDWNPDFHYVVNTSQTFDFNKIYFYFPTLNLFFESTRNIHAVYRAAKTLFDDERWEEIQDVLDEYDVWRQLHSFNFALARRKILRARDIGLITSQEVSDMAALVAHLH